MFSRYLLLDKSQKIEKLNMDNIEASSTIPKLQLGKSHDEF